MGTTRKVIPRPLLLPLVCSFVVVSLFCLIDKSQGVSPEFGHRSSGGVERERKQGLNSTTPNSSSGESNVEEARNGFFSRQLFRRNKRRRSTTTTTVSSDLKPSTVRSKFTLSDRVDNVEDISYDNETSSVVVERARNKTVTLDDKVEPPIEEEDNFCPNRTSSSSSSMRSVLQSTLPAYEIMLFGMVNIVAFVVFLYVWKNIYYETEDLYATVSPYGFGPGPSTPAPMGRSWDERDEIMSRVQKSIQR